MGVPVGFYLLRTVDFAVGWGYGIGQNYRFFILAGVVPCPLPQHVTELLTDWEKGDQALQALIPISMTSSA